MLKDSEHIIGRALLCRRHNIEKSLEALYKAVEKDPTNPLPHLLIAHFYLEEKLKDGELKYDPTPAILHLKKAINLDPTNGYINHRLAEAYFIRFGATKVDDILTEIKKGNQAKDYNLYEAQIIRAMYRAQKNDSIPEIRKQYNALTGPMGNLLIRRMIANRLVVEAEKLMLSGDEAKAIEHFSAIMQNGNRTMGNSKTLIPQMIAIAIKDIARQPLMRIHHGKVNIENLQRLGLDSIKEDTAVRNQVWRYRYNQSFTWISQSEFTYFANAFIILAVLVIILILLSCRIIWPANRQIFLKILTISVYLISYTLVICILIYLSLTYIETPGAYKYTSKIPTILLLITVVSLTGILIYRIIRHLRLRALRKSGIIIPTRESPTLLSIIVLLATPFLYLVFINLSYISTNNLIRDYNIENYSEVPDNFYPTDEQVQQTLKRYLQESDSLIAESIKEWNAPNSLDLRALLYSRNQQFAEKIAPFLESLKISNSWISENYNPAFVPVAKKAMLNKEIKDRYGWELRIIAQSQDKDVISILRKAYNDKISKDPTLYERDYDLQLIIMSLFTLGDKELFYELIAKSPEFMRKVAMYLSPSWPTTPIITDKTFRQQIIKEMGKGWLELDCALNTVGIPIPFKGKEEIEQITNLGIKHWLVFDILRECANEDAIEPLTTLLNKENKIGTERIIFALGELNAKESIEIIKSHQSSEDAGIRRACLYALSKLVTKEELMPILDQLQNDKDFYVQKAIWQLRNLN